jgi:fatty acid desaturase
MVTAGATVRYPIPAALNAAMATGQLVLVVFCVWNAGRVTGGLPLVLTAVSFAVVMNSAYSLMHESEHGILFRTRLLNDALGVVIGLFFPAPFHLLRQGHLVHHVRNRSDDECFDLYFEDEPRAWKYLQFYGLLTGFFWVTVAVSNVIVVIAPFLLSRRYFRFDRPTAGLMAVFNRRELAMIRAEATAAIGLHIALPLLLGVAFWRYALLYAAFGFSWSALQYVHHFETERHVTRGARNLWAGQPFDWIWLNRNWHRVHHEHPTVPWVYLPMIGQQSSPKRGFLLSAYFRMWRGPRYADERVENRFEGEVIA